MVNNLVLLTRAQKINYYIKNKSFGTSGKAEEEKYRGGNKEIDREIKNTGESSKVNKAEDFI